MAKTRADNGKRDEVLTALRRRVIDGTYGAGARLPTVRTIGAEFSTSVLTVHKALQVLVDDGLVVTDGRRGTSVVEHPPHRCRYALLLGAEPDAAGRYPAANLAAQAMAAAAWDDPTTSVATYHIGGPHPELPEHQRLLADLAAGRVAGLLKVDGFARCPWLDPAVLGVPTVGGPPPRPPRHWGGLHCIHLHFLTAALDAARELGGRHLGVLELSEGTGLHHVDQLLAGAAERGLELARHRILPAPVAHPGWIGHVVAALRHGDAPVDTLIVGDDNLLPAVCAALDAAGVGPGDCRLVGMANYPHLVPCTRPVLRLGWDHREFLRRAIALIDRFHREGTPIGDHALPVRREDALAAARPAPR